MRVEARCEVWCGDGHLVLPSSSGEGPAAGAVGHRLAVLGEVLGRVRLHPGPPCHLGAVRRVEALRQGDKLGTGPRSLPNLGGVMVVDVVELIMVVDVIKLIMVQVVASGAPWPRPWRGSPPC